MASTSQFSPITYSEHDVLPVADVLHPLLVFQIVGRQKVYPTYIYMRESTFPRTRLKYQDYLTLPLHASKKIRLSTFPRNCRRTGTPGVGFNR